MIFKLRQLGLAVIIVGMSIGMYLNYFVSNIGWNSIIVFFAVLCLPNWNNLLRLRLPTLNALYISLLLYQIICIAYLFLSPAPKEVPFAQLLTMHLLIIFLVISFSSLKSEDLDYHKIINYSWVLSLVCVMACFLCIVSGIWALEYAKTHDGSGYKSIFSELGMGSTCTTYIICSFFYNSKNWYSRFFVLVGIIMCIICLFAVNKRTPLIVTAAVVFLYMYRSCKFSFKVKKKNLIISFIICILLTIVIQNKEILNFLNAVWEYSVNGIIDMFTGSTKSGMAAVERYKAKIWALNYIAENFLFINYIIGGGYMVRWLDIPILQSYLDMGIIGFVFFVFYELIYPVNVMFSKWMKYRIIKFAFFLNIYNILAIYTSGYPYVFAKWWPVIFLIHVVYIAKKQKYKEKQIASNVLVC